MTTPTHPSSIRGAPSASPSRCSFHRTTFSDAVGGVVRSFLRCSMCPIPTERGVLERDLDPINVIYIVNTTMRLLSSMKGHQILGLVLLFWLQACSGEQQQQQAASTSASNTTATSTTNSQTTTAATTSSTTTTENVCRVCGGNGNTVDNEYRMVSTTFGIFTCGALAQAGIHGNIPVDDCDAAKVAAVEKCGCLLPDGSSAANQTTTSNNNCTSICPNSGVVTLPDAIVEIPGSTEALSCQDHATLALAGQIQTEQCENLHLYTNETCGCKDIADIDVIRPENTESNATFVCPVCGQGMVSSTPDAIVRLPSRTVRSCRDFEEAASLGRISSQQCGLLKSYMEASCRCVVGSPIAAPTPAPVQFFDCPICGEGMVVTRPNGIVMIPTQPNRTCSQLLRANTLGKIKRQQCGLLQPFVQQRCGCIPQELTRRPTGTPTVAPTLAPTPERVPTASPAPTGWTAQKEGCFDNLMAVYEMERDLQDPSENRRYTLCPDTTYHLGELREDGQIINGDAFLMLRPNVMYQCGDNGSRQDNCVLKGGDFGLLSLYGVYEGVFETVENVQIKGITFESQLLFGAVMGAAGDIQFIDCAFKNHANMAPVLMQWRGEGPSVPTAASRDRKLRSATPTSDSVLVQFKQRVLARTAADHQSASRQLQVQETETEFTHKVTFNGCVFRGNHVGAYKGFPGIIENSFRSVLHMESCIFQDNHYTEETNPAPFSYAVRSYGPIHVESSCFMDNSFQAHGPVQVFGAPHTTMGNYVDQQDDLTCEFLAVFASRDDTTDGIPVCFDSDAISCPVNQSPTLAPTRGPPTPTTMAPVESGVPNEDEETTSQQAQTVSAGTSSISSKSIFGLISTSVMGVVMMFLTP